MDRAKDEGGPSDDLDGFLELHLHGAHVEAKGKTTTCSAESISSVMPSAVKPICISARPSACGSSSMPVLMNSNGKWRKQGGPGSERKEGASREIPTTP